MSDKNGVRKWLGRFCLFFILVIVTTSVHGQDTSVVKQLNVLGTSVIHGKNLAKGKQNAVNNALLAAVSQTVLELLTEETVVRRFQLINNNILSKRDAYVQNYRVLTESVSGTTVRVLVQADVGVDRISRDLKKLGVKGDVRSIYLFNEFFQLLLPKTNFPVIVLVSFQSLLIDFPD